MAIGDWLERARITDDPAGDLIADMKADRNLPLRNVTSFGALRSYLISKNACHEAIKAARIVCRRYRNWQDRNPFSRKGDVRGALRTFGPIGGRNVT
jgi:hypothetical protein